MRNDYLLQTLEVIDDANILVNVVSKRVKQLRRGARSMVVSLEKLELEDVALREVFERKISYELGDDTEAPSGMYLGSSPRI
ncbi:MAG: DNA-directed RNA polymerase subunit omega [Candidatus Synoicihabitans palmerolidicus]|nr:DNA-directed RNA polymerase subunit omega [Candidatus Synoicihabitans palmerolidicus]